MIKKLALEQWNQIWCIRSSSTRIHAEHGWWKSIDIQHLSQKASCDRPSSTTQPSFTHLSCMKLGDGGNGQSHEGVQSSDSSKIVSELTLGVDQEICIAESVPSSCMQVFQENGPCYQVSIPRQRFYTLCISSAGWDQEMKTALPREDTWQSQSQSMIHWIPPRNRVQMHPS